MRYSELSHFEKPVLDENLGIQVYLHEGRSWVQSHWHKEMEIVHAVEGVVTIEASNQIIHLKKGESIILRPGEVHSFISSPGSVRLAIQYKISTLVESLYGEYSGPYIESYLEKIENKTTEWDEVKKEEFTKYIQKTYQEFKRSCSNRRVQVLNQTSNLMLLLLNEIPHSDEAEVQGVSLVKRFDSLEKLDEIYEFIESNYYREISLEEISQVVGYSKHYFARFFKEHTGTTFVTFLNQYRLDQAKWLLITTNSPMSHVAYKSGFQSTKRFHHVFKEYTGTSPLQYRKEMLNKQKGEL